VRQAKRSAAARRKLFSSGLQEPHPRQARVWKKGAMRAKLLWKRRNSTIYGIVLASESPLQGLPQG